MPISAPRISCSPRSSTRRAGRTCVVTNFLPGDETDVRAALTAFAGSTAAVPAGGAGAGDPPRGDQRERALPGTRPRVLRQRSRPCSAGCSANGWPSRPSAGRLAVPDPGLAADQFIGLLRGGLYLAGDARPDAADGGGDRRRGGMRRWRPSCGPTRPASCSACVVRGGRLAMQRALRLVVGANVVLGDVALLVLVDRGEMVGNRLVAGLRLILGQMAVVRDVGLLEMLLHGLPLVRRARCWSSAPARRTSATARRAVRSGYAWRESSWWCDVPPDCPFHANGSLIRPSDTAGAGSVSS